MQTTDSDGNTYAEALTINVNDVNEPTFTSDYNDVNGNPIILRKNGKTPIFSIGNLTSAGERLEQQPEDFFNKSLSSSETIDYLTLSQGDGFWNNDYDSVNLSDHLFENDSVQFFGQTEANLNHELLNKSEDSNYLAMVGNSVLTGLMG